MYLYAIIIRFTYYFIGVILLTIPLQSNSQLRKEKYFVKHYDLESGISQCVITDIMQDNKGFIWLSTYDGLNRFDGYEFKIFRPIPDDSTSLPSSKILKMFYDNGQHLWLRCNNSLHPFNIQKGKIVSSPTLYPHTVLSVCEWNNKRMWGYTNDNKLILIDKKSLAVEFTSIPNTWMLPNDEILELICTNNIVFAASKRGNLFRYSREDNKWQRFLNPLITTPTEYNNVAFDHKHTIFLGSVQNDLIEFDMQKNTFGVSPINSKNIQLIGINDMFYAETDDALIISTYGQGIFFYNIKERNITQYKKGDGQLPLAANYPLCIIKDKNNTFWIGYDGNGFDVLDPNIKKFTPIQHDSTDDHYDIKFVRKIVEDNNGTIWLATAGSGLVEYNRSSQKIVFHNTGKLTPIAESFIIEMIKVGNTLWLGLNGGGVHIFDLAQRKVVKTIRAGEGDMEIKGTGIWSMLYDETANTVWIGTVDKGLNKVDIKTGSIKNYYAPKNTLYEGNGMRCLQKSTENVLLVGTTNGVLRYNEAADIFEKMYPNTAKNKSNTHSIKCIYQDTKDRYWLGTDGGGVVVLNKNFEMLRNFTTRDMLSNNVVYGILPQDKNNLWVSTNDGLCRIHWTDKVFTHKADISVSSYNVQSGLQGSEYNTNAYLKLRDGSLAFGGTDGVNIFKGEKIRPSKILSNVLITDFAVFNRKIENTKLISYLNEINLDYNQNSFSLKYNTVGLTLAEGIQYRYRLLGYDKDWVEAGDRTYVSYTNLNPGEYEFEVMASNYDGFWSNDITSLNINIESPVYKSVWFILSGIAVLTLFIIVVVRDRISVRNNRERLKIMHNKELAEVEMKALRAQINPHFLFNSLNSINNFILKNDNANARKYLVKFSQLVRNILNNSTSPYVSLKEELDTIQLYVQIESMRFDNQFNFNIAVPTSMNTAEVNIPSLLLQPYIENAIWHGLLHKDGSKSIEIRIKKTSDQLISIEIEDNGIGRRAAEKLAPNENKRKSYGMQLGENRLKLMNSSNQQQGDVEVIDLYDQNEVGRGTLISITLPIIENIEPAINNNLHT